MLNGIITIVFGVLVSWAGAKFLSGVLAKATSIVGLVITIVGIYYLVMALL